VDDTDGFLNTGTNFVTFFPPTDWTATTIDTVSAYWIRCRVDTYTSGGGGLGTQGWTWRLPLLAAVDLSTAIGDCEVFGTLFAGLKGGVSFAADTGHFVTNCTFERCAQVAPGTVQARNLVFTGYEETSRAAMLIASTTDVDNSQFLANTRAVEHATEGSISYDGLTFTGNDVDIVNSNDATTTDSWTTQDSTQALYGGSTEGVGQSITGDGGLLTSVTLKLKKTLAPTGNAVVKLYAHSGTFGTSSIPTGAELATSKTLDVSTLTTSYQDIKIDFDDSEFYTLVNATKYVIAIEYAGGDASNTLDVGYDAGGSHGGNLSTYNGATWTPVAADDLYFYVRTEGEVTVNATNGSDPTLTDEVGIPAGVTNINNTKTLTVTTKLGATLVDGIRVRVENTSTGALIMEGTTVSGIVTDSTYNYTGDEAVTVVARLKGYQNYRATDTIGSGGLSHAAALQVDENVDLP
jgi:hypothetical protein